MQNFYSKANKATNGPYPDIPDAPSPDVLEIQAKTPLRYRLFSTRRAAAICQRLFAGPGGTTLHWLGNVPRMLPNDFKMHSLYGQGVDWPISYEDIKPLL